MIGKASTIPMPMKIVVSRGPGTSGSGISEVVVDKTSSSVLYFCIDFISYIRIQRKRRANIDWYSSQR
jgi:hypothetical protein